MAITLADFVNIWASSSPLTPYSFSTSNYEEGWNFVGSTPPARQMWDSIQKQNDEKMKYIVDNFLPLSGGTLTGAVESVTPASNDNSTKVANTEWVVGFAKDNLFLLKDAKVPTIPNNSDLNDYDTAGTYRTSSSSGTATLSNCPVSSYAIKLFVIETGYGSSNYCMQIILAGARSLYFRTRTTSTWTVWGKVSYTDV